MKQVRVLLMMVFFSGAVTGVKAGWRDKTENANYIHRSVKAITDVIVYDIYSPPVASRTYAYISIAGYEAAINGATGYTTLAGQLHQLAPVPKPAAGKDYSATLAAVQAILTVGKALVISEDRVSSFQEKLLQEFKREGMPDDVFANSVAYGQQVAKHVLDWAAKDNYKQTRSLARYAVSEDAATWKPTPPAYIKAIEPHWNMMRTFLIDSAQQFKPISPTPFSLNKKSKFYKQALAVHDIGVHLTPEQNEIANFWDCNPFKVNVRGHVLYATKKISPGGHWVNITRLVCRQAEAGVCETAAAYARVSVAIADCFISCWDEKYRSNVIRPETYINQYMDAGWMPLLQTPPFPEYTSGHSVVSAAAAVVLTDLFGENFAYTDSTETEFELPVRHFKSFQHAASEAAISRYYGGIHYMPSITNGLQEGRQIGAFVVSLLITNKNKAQRNFRKGAIPAVSTTHLSQP